MNVVINYWHTLTRRDQVSLLIGGFAVLIAIVWWLLIQPANQALAVQQVQTRNAAETLAHVREMALELKGFRGSSDSGSASQAPLSELIDRSLRARGMRLGSFQPVRDGEVRVRLDDAPYGQFISWLVEMENEQGLITRELTITPTRVSGRVSVNLQLAR